MTRQTNADGLQLAGQADQVRRAIGGDWWIMLLRRLSHRRLGRRRDWPRIRDLGSPWQDNIAVERTGWRSRAAWLDGDQVFTVDYRVCQRCRTGWVEGPSTDEPLRRCGLAAAGLGALRTEYPGLTWYTLGGHFVQSRPFWATVGRGVPGGYQQSPLCPHVEAG